MSIKLNHKTVTCTGYSSGVVGLGTLSSVKAVSNPSPGDESSRFSARGSMSFWLLVSVLYIC